MIFTHVAGTCTLKKGQGNSLNRYAQVISVHQAVRPSGWTNNDFSGRSKICFPLTAFCHHRGLEKGQGRQTGMSGKTEGVMPNFKHLNPIAMVKTVNASATGGQTNPDKYIVC